jgi:CRISPR-associated protein Cas1
LRSTRGLDRDASGVSAAIETLRGCLRNIAKTQRADELRGYEGLAGRAYFSAIPSLLREAVPEELRFDHRNRRPPRDRFNALLSFGYSLLYQAVFQAVAAVGLEPALGFFHTPRSAAYPLVLDVMELFRVPLWDMVLIGSVNRLQWDPAGDFAVTPGRVWLSQNGRKKAIQLFERRLTETWKHPVVSYSLSYARLIELEVRLLEKEWTGRPGLFARMRIR